MLPPPLSSRLTSPILPASPLILLRSTAPRPALLPILWGPTLLRPLLAIPPASRRPASRRPLVPRPPVPRPLARRPPARRPRVEVHPGRRAPRPPRSGAGRSSCRRLRSPRPTGWCPRRDRRNDRLARLVPLRRVLSLLLPTSNLACPPRRFESDAAAQAVRDLPDSSDLPCRTGKTAEPRDESKNFQPPIVHTGNTHSADIVESGTLNFTIERVRLNNVAGWSRQKNITHNWRNTQWLVQ